MTPPILYLFGKEKFRKNSKLLIFSIFTLLLLATAIAYAGIDSMEPYSKGWWYIYISPYYRIFDYICGSLLAYIFINMKNIYKSSNMLIGSIFEILAVIVIPYFYFTSKFLRVLAIRYDIFNVPMALLLIFVLSFEKGFISKILSSKFFTYLGSLSFLIFMLHQIVLRFARKFFNVPIDFIPENRTTLFLQLGLFLMIIVLSEFLNNHLLVSLKKKALPQAKPSSSTTK